MKIKIDLPYCDKVDSIAKANSVQFVDLTPFDNKIIDAFKSVDDLNKFRLNLYNLYKTKVKISFVTEYDEYRGTVQGFSLKSDIFSLSDNDIGRCLPFYVVKQFYRRSNIQHKYINRDRVLFFDYI